MKGRTGDSLLQLITEINGPDFLLVVFQNQRGSILKSKKKARKPIAHTERAAVAEDGTFRVNMGTDGPPQATSGKWVASSPTGFVKVYSSIAETEREPA